MKSPDMGHKDGPRQRAAPMRVSASPLQIRSLGVGSKACDWGTGGGGAEQRLQELLVHWRGVFDRDEEDHRGMAVVY